MVCFLISRDMYIIDKFPNSRYSDVIYAIPEDTVAKYTSFQFTLYSTNIREINKLKILQPGQYNFNMRINIYVLENNFFRGAQTQL